MGTVLGHLLATVLGLSANSSHAHVLAAFQCGCGGRARTAPLLPNLLSSLLDGNDEWGSLREKPERAGREREMRGESGHGRTTETGCQGPVSVYLLQISTFNAHSHAL